MALDHDEINLAEVTLDALISSLQLQGYNLDNIFTEYKNKILGNELSPAPPQYKNASTELLREKIELAKANTVLQK
jgi:hypothetical protein